MPTYKVDIRWPATQTLEERTVTVSAAAAEVAFRELLSRADLVGQDCAARLMLDRRQLHYSEFNKPLGAGRLAPDAPLNLPV